MPKATTTRLPSPGLRDYADSEAAADDGASLWPTLLVSVLASVHRPAGASPRVQARGRRK